MIFLRDITLNAITIIALTAFQNYSDKDLEHTEQSPYDIEDDITVTLWMN